MSRWMQQQQRMVEYYSNLEKSVLQQLFPRLIHQEQVLEESPYSRMKSVVRWYLSGFYKKPKVHALRVHLHMQLHPSAFIITHVCVDALQVKPTCLYLCKVVKHTHKHVCTHTLKCAHLHAHIHAWAHTHMYMRTLTHTHAHTRTCTCSLVHDLTRQTHNYAN